jgi:hypothetical protein
MLFLSIFPFYIKTCTIYSLFTQKISAESLTVLVMETSKETIAILLCAGMV